MGFSNNMNIQNSNFLVNFNNKQIMFTAKPKALSTKVPNVVYNDILELSNASADKLPVKFEFTKIEETAKEIIKELYKTIQDLIVQKNNLRYYYSASDKYDYQELLKKKRSLNNQLNRLNKKGGYEEYQLEHMVKQKKEYNYYANKIYKANSIEELDAIYNKLGLGVSYSVKKLLFQLIELRRNSVKNREI